MAKTKSMGSGFLLSEIDEGQLFTPEDFTEEHKMIGTSARQFIEQEVAPLKEEIESQDFGLVKELLKKAGDLGLLAHSIPEQYGGLGLDKITKGIVGENIGASSGYGVAHSNHTCIATLPITYFGTEEQKNKYLPKMASGEYIGAYCLTEPNAGSDALSSQTVARLNEAGTHYILNGTKLYITNAAFSDTFIVYAKVDGKDFTSFILEKDFPGLVLGPEENKMGIKGSSTRSVILEDCEVPAENMLGEQGKGHVIALNVLNLGRFNLGSACMGAAKYSLKKAAQYTQERRQFGRKIADFNATKEKVGKMAARIYASESMQYRTAGLLEEALGDIGDIADSRLAGKRMSEYASECAVCKVFGSETLDYAADETLQLYGGAGFIKEYGIEQIYRDSRINRIFEGTNEINRLLIPAGLFKKAAKGEVDIRELTEEAASAILQPAPLNGALAMEREAVSLMRHAFLLAAGLALQVHGQQISEEQETLMKLSDMAISLYAAESAVYRTYKSINKAGEEAAALKIDLAGSYLEEALWECEKAFRILSSELALREDEKKLASAVERGFRRIELNGGGFSRNRRIAERIYHATRYVC
ncbi:acyl-CoA dehydrogenase family protein [Bacillus infantis]|uniref:acyl-CoA dehydrogenase family protein n=1 Tax=Bacillus infantis TaxID=324767 RepID=UPI003CF314C6